MKCKSKYRSKEEGDCRAALMQALCRNDLKDVWGKSSQILSALEWRDLGSVLWNRNHRCFSTVTGKMISSFVRAGASCTAEGSFLLKSKLVPLAFLVKRREPGRVKGGGKAMAGMKRLPCDAEDPWRPPWECEHLHFSFPSLIADSGKYKSCQARGSVQPRWETLLERQMVISII